MDNKGKDSEVVFQRHIITNDNVTKKTILSPSARSKQGAIFEPVDQDPLTSTYVKDQTSVDYEQEEPTIPTQSVNGRYDGRDIMHRFDEHNGRIDRYTNNQRTKEVNIQQSIDDNNQRIERFMGDRRHLAEYRRLAKMANRVESGGGRLQGAVYEKVLAQHRRRVARFWRRKRDEARTMLAANLASQREWEKEVAKWYQIKWKAAMAVRAHRAFNDELQLESWLHQLGIGMAHNRNDAMRKLSKVHINIYDLLENRFITHPSARALSHYSKVNGLVFPRHQIRCSALRIFLKAPKRSPHQSSTTKTKTRTS